MIEFYRTAPLYLRIAIVCCAATLFTAAYCQAYTHFAGDRETLAEAIGWGLINVAPWVAAVEIGRHSGRVVDWLVAIIGALAVSLALEWAIANNVAPAFEIVRRIPGMVLAFGALAALDNLARRRASPAIARTVPDLSGIEWIRGAGNYLELHTAGMQPQIIRATLRSVLREHAADFVRVHRSYLVRRSMIARIDVASVLLENGKRVPLGQRYRMAVSPA